MELQIGLFVIRFTEIYNYNRNIRNVADKFS